MYLFSKNVIFASAISLRGFCHHHLIFEKSFRI